MYTSIKSPKCFCISKQLDDSLFQRTSLYICAGVRTCVNEFCAAISSQEKKRPNVSSWEIIDTDTSGTDSISCSPPFHKSHRLLCLPVLRAPHKTGFVILWKKIYINSQIDLSWLQQKDWLCWKWKCRLGPAAAPDGPRRTLKETAGAFSLFDRGLYDVTLCALDRSDYY